MLFRFEGLIFDFTSRLLLFPFWFDIALADNRTEYAIKPLPPTKESNELVYTKPTL